MAKGPLSQIVLAFVMSVVLYIILIALETVYISYMQVSRTRTVIKDETVSNGTVQTYTTNPIATEIENKHFRNLPYSDNERSGIEYSYACFLYIKEETFENNISSYRHIFHKGSESLYPLLGPGVFINAGENTLRIYQNTTLTWHNHVDIQDIPVGKWFHFVLLVKNNATEIYINGNIAGKIANDNCIIYQNYQNLYVFVDNKRPDFTSATLPSLTEGESYKIIGSAKGMMSRFYYYSYALSYTEIQDLMNMGPNPKIDTTDMDKPPYFIDNWWTGRNMLM